ncbi:SHC binding and spindle associated nessun dorma [Dermatophagoides farinae]|uniref:SHC SH2 domain-binding protein n=1 Tax=Dermatophagoides farinae TaxID=6954 RepID=A0A922LCF5_DERFA|nr:SHC SH2 domain-binding protein 1 homolog B-like [Dermatophagoides farinae]KAH7642183.1 hypothetical protein HUG17_5228 [Dermatophagoides farinae]KAH9529332.1 SHC SH2 domain-binding protein [Dermatophagoides farinae]
MSSMPIDSGCDTDSLEEEKPKYETYNFKFLRADLEKIYEEILQDVPIDSVFDSFSNYITNNIEPVGWKAIWIPWSDNFRHSSRFLVEVTNVLESMEASVLIMKRVSNNNNNNEDDDDALVNELNELGERKVPLIELFVISDDDEDKLFYKTAFIIEVIRFFYLNLWRPWDDVDDQYHDEIFLTHRFIPRLNLVFDIKNNVIDKNIISRFESIISEAQSIKKSMDKLNLICKKEQELQQDEDYFNDINSVEYWRLTIKLEKYQRAMRFIENPELRNLYEEFVSEEFDDLDNERVLHLVSNSDFESLSKAVAKLGFSLTEEKTKTKVKLHDSFPKALSRSKSGDSIYLCAGNHVQKLSWIEKNLEIYGIEPDVKICSSHDCGDLFIFVNVPGTLKISNVTIKAVHPIDQLICLKSGHLILEDCVLDFNQSVMKKEPIRKLDDAQLTLINTKIIGQ